MQVADFFVRAVSIKFTAIKPPFFVKVLKNLPPKTPNFSIEELLKNLVN